MRASPTGSLCAHPLPPPPRPGQPLSLLSPCALRLPVSLGRVPFLAGPSSQPLGCILSLLTYPGASGSPSSTLHTSGAPSSQLRILPRPTPPASPLCSIYSSVLSPPQPHPPPTNAHAPARAPPGQTSAQRSQLSSQQALFSLCPSRSPAQGRAGSLPSNGTLPAGR